jgi:hypothetical protein
MKCIAAFVPPMFSSPILDAFATVTTAALYNSTFPVELPKVSIVEGVAPPVNTAKPFTVNVPKFTGAVMPVSALASTEKLIVAGIYSRCDGLMQVANGLGISDYVPRHNVVHNIDGFMCDAPRGR